MDIYLTNKATGARLRLPMNPDRMTTSGSASTVAHNPITVGEVKTPRGNKLYTYAWEGVLPGATMKNASWVRDWREPNKILAELEQFQKSGTRLTLMVTGTNINTDVFVERLNSEYSGGGGNIEYSISLTEWRDIIVKTVQEAGIPEPTDPNKKVTIVKTTKVYYKVKITSKNSGGYARIYKSKSSSSKVLKKLKNGAVVLYVDGTSDKTWAKCTYGSVTGWMRKQDITYSKTEVVEVTTTT